MNYIVLSDDQARTISTAVGPIQVRDSQGNIVGYLPLVWTSADIAEANRILTSETTWHTTAEVQAYLLSSS